MTIFESYVTWPQTKGKGSVQMFIMYHTAGMKNMKVKTNISWDVAWMYLTVATFFTVSGSWFQWGWLPRDAKRSSAKRQFWLTGMISNSFEAWAQRGSTRHVLPSGFKIIRFSYTVATKHRLVLSQITERQGLHKNPTWGHNSRKSVYSWNNYRDRKKTTTNSEKNQNQ